MLGHVLLKLCGGFSADLLCQSCLGATRLWKSSKNYNSAASSLIFVQRRGSDGSTGWDPDPALFVQIRVGYGIEDQLLAYWEEKHPECTSTPTQTRAKLAALPTWHSFREGEYSFLRNDMKEVGYTFAWGGHHVCPFAAQRFLGILWLSSSGCTTFFYYKTNLPSLRRRAVIPVASQPSPPSTWVGLLVLESHNPLAALVLFGMMAKVW